MKRIFRVRLSKALYPIRTVSYEVVANTAEEAIGKAKRRARAVKSDGVEAGSSRNWLIAAKPSDAEGRNETLLNTTHTSD